MKAGPFRTYIISLLLVLAICGARVANAWDFSDYHDVHILHLEQASPCDTDMDDVKHKQLILTTITIGPYFLPLPETVARILSPKAVQLIHPLSNLALSLPSRAPPA